MGKSANFERCFFNFFPIIGKTVYLWYMEKQALNPFLYNNKLDLVKVVENQYLGKSNSFDLDGHVTDHAKITTIVATRFVERDRKVSLYKVENVKGLIAALTPMATKLYLYITLSLGEQMDYVKLTLTEVQKELNIGSKNTLYKAIEELESYSIIAKKRNGEFWINPFLLFNGNRIDYFQKNYPENVNIAATIKR
jgi:hypothetical protein